MPKRNPKSGWKQRDKQFRLDQNRRAKMNRGRKILRALANVGRV